MSSLRALLPPMPVAEAFGLLLILLAYAWAG